MCKKVYQKMTGLSTPLLDDSILAHHPRACQLWFSVFVVTYARCMVACRRSESKFLLKSLLSNSSMLFSYDVPMAEGTGIEPATLYQSTAVPKRPLTIRLPSVIVAGLEPAAT